MKKLLILLLVGAMLVPGLAAAEEFEGNVVAAETTLVTSPYGGVVQNVSVREGEKISAGDTLAAMQTVKVYAPEDGTVRGIFAETGDDVTDVEVLYIAPVSEYEISCTTDKAYDAMENDYVKVGETVYVVYLTNRSYNGTGVITAVDGTSYTVQTTEADLYLDKTVYIYRDEDHTSKSRIGSGTVSRVAETAVYGSGSLLKLYVENGEEVTRGQLLFETVSGEMTYTASDDGIITSDINGIIESINIAAGDTVSKDDVLMTVIQSDQFEIEFAISEDMLNTIYIGQNADIVFNWNESTGEVIQGTVTRISYASTSDEDEEDTTGAQYTGYITFEANDTVKLGMSVTIETLN